MDEAVTDRGGKVRACADWLLGSNSVAKTMQLYRGFKYEANSEGGNSNSAANRASYVQRQI